MKRHDQTVGRRLTLATLVAMVVSFAAPALADCYDFVGCTNQDDFNQHYSDYLASSANGPTCDYLYQMRNRIYAEHGYCFTTPRGISEIGNQGCHIHDQAQVPLSNIERNNVAVILRAENARRCSI